MGSTSEYYIDDRSTTAFKLRDDDILVANMKLHGRVYDITTAALGRGDETVEAKTTELLSGGIPFVGDGLAILGEIINGIDPSTEMNKMNLILAVMGLTADCLDGGATSFELAHLRIGLKEMSKASSAYVRRTSSRIWDLLKLKSYKEVKDYAGGVCKIARHEGGEFLGRIVKDETEEASINRLMRVYSPSEDASFVRRIAGAEITYANSEALRRTLLSLADFKDASGALIRLSDDAVEGAVKFMAKAGDDIAMAEREQLLKKLLMEPEHVEASLKFIRELDSPDAIEGFAAMVRDVPVRCRQ